MSEDGGEVDETWGEGCGGGGGEEEGVGACPGRGLEWRPLELVSSALHGVPYMFGVGDASEEELSCEWGELSDFWGILSWCAESECGEHGGAFVEECGEVSHHDFEECDEGGWDVESSQLFGEMWERGGGDEDNDGGDAAGSGEDEIEE